jgi:hypothetical protein
MRQCIERCFGVFVARWGIFRRPLTFGASKWGLVAGVCAKLHNFCIKEGEGKAGAPYAKDILVGDEEIVLQIDNANDEDKGEPKRSGGVGSSLRRTLTTAIGEWGHIRPPTNVSRNATAT